VGNRLQQSQEVSTLQPGLVGRHRKALHIRLTTSGALDGRHLQQLTHGEDGVRLQRRKALLPITAEIHLEDGELHLHPKLQVTTGQDGVHLQRREASPPVLAEIHLEDGELHLHPKLQVTTGQDGVHLQRREASPPVLAEIHLEDGELHLHPKLQVTTGQDGVRLQRQEASLPVMAEVHSQDGVRRQRREALRPVMAEIRLQDGVRPQRRELLRPVTGGIHLQVKVQATAGEVGVHPRRLRRLEFLQAPGEDLVLLQRHSEDLPATGEDLGSHPRLPEPSQRAMEENSGAKEFSEMVVGSKDRRLQLTTGAMDGALGDQELRRLLHGEVGDLNPPREANRARLRHPSGDKAILANRSQQSH
jgi:hypothetical protein